MPLNQRLRSTSAQRLEQNGRNCGTRGLPQIGQAGVGGAVEAESGMALI
jgi:hypothetical protein